MRRLIALALFVACSIGQAFAALKSADIGTVHTNFVGPAQLNPAEIQTVIQLVRRCGVPRVAKIETYNIHPSPYFGIRAMSPETIRGREVSYTTVHITRKQWSSFSSATNMAMPRGWRFIGDFWVEPYNVITTRLTEFKLTNQVVRVAVSGVPLTVADHIFETFSKGRLRYSQPSLAGKIKGIDSSRPDSIGIASRPDAHERVYQISFRNGELAWCIVTFKLEGDEAVVLDIMHVIS